MRIGIVSDNHGRIPRKLAEVLDGCDAVLHAGDICGQASLDAISDMTPVLYAVLGNNDDPADYRDDIPYTRVEELGGVEFVLGHEPEVAVKARNQATGLGSLVTVHGHTHVPRIEWRSDQDLFVCPGALAFAPPDTARSIAIVEVENGDILSTEIVPLSGASLG